MRQVDLTEKMGSKDVSSDPQQKKCKQQLKHPSRIWSTAFVTNIGAVSLQYSNFTHWGL